MALIAGPTASGKSDLAVALALELERRGGRAVVVNADSAQIYADLQVLSARPTAAEMHGVEHRLFGTWDGAQACSAAYWAAAAKSEIARAHGAGAVPILVGGTGLYIRTLLEGIAPVPSIDPVVREEVRALAPNEAWEALRSEDAAGAQALHPGDRARVARALEVVRATGRPLADWQRYKEGGIGHAIELHPLILLPERKALYASCDRRFAGMVERGARDEVEQLLGRNLPRSLPVMRAIGVPQVTGWIADLWGRAQAVEKGAQATRNYAKRQFTWFRHQPPPTWRRVSDKSCAVAPSFETLFLSSGLT